MAQVISGAERRSRQPNAKKEATSSPSSKRRGERQKQPKADAIQGRGVKKQNTRGTQKRSKPKG